MIDNECYEEIKDNWYADCAHPIMLLRKENAVRNPWILETIEKKLGKEKRILDIGCGGGLLANALALANHSVTGIDLSPGSLTIAQKYDQTRTVRYLRADAAHLPFPDHHFDVVTVMDVLEHVENPKRVIQEASRVLRSEGLLFFHTFNRNWISWLFVIKGVEWCIPNTPPHLHVLKLFIKPKELVDWRAASQIAVEECLGFSPKVTSLSFWKGLFQGKLHEEVEFHFSSSLLTGYAGFGRKGH